MPILWGTWAGSVFTGLAVGSALYQIGMERRNRKLAEQRQQAAKVTAWLVRPWDIPAVAAVLNNSDEPAYQVILTIVAIQGAAARTGLEGGPSWPYRAYLGVLPPGKFYLTIPSGGHGMMLRFAIEICFTDAGGRSWVRLAKGSLTAIKHSPVDYYGLPRPIGWEYPEHETIADFLHRNTADDEKDP